MQSADPGPRRGPPKPAGVMTFSPPPSAGGSPAAAAAGALAVAERKRSRLRYMGVSALHHGSSVSAAAPLRFTTRRPRQKMRCLHGCARRRSSPSQRPQKSAYGTTSNGSRAGGCLPRGERGDALPASECSPHGSAGGRMPPSAPRNAPATRSRCARRSCGASSASRTTNSSDRLATGTVTDWTRAARSASARDGSPCPALRQVAL